MPWCGVSTRNLFLGASYGMVDKLENVGKSQFSVLDYLRQKSFENEKTEYKNVVVYNEPPKKNLIGSGKVQTLVLEEPKTKKIKAKNLPWDKRYDALLERLKTEPEGKHGRLVGKFVRKLSEQELKAIPLEVENQLVILLMESIQYELSKEEESPYSGHTTRHDLSKEHISTLYRIATRHVGFEQTNRVKAEAAGKALATDQSFQTVRKDWSKMDANARLAAMETIVGTIAKQFGLSPIAVRTVDEPLRRGIAEYDAQTNEIVFNTRRDGLGDFAEVLNSAAHMVCHAFQMQLAHGVANEEIDADHPDFTQAVSFLLNLQEYQKHTRTEEEQQIFFAQPLQDHAINTAKLICDAALTP